MFTPRQRRRRRSLDTYVRGEVEERRSAPHKAPVSLRPDPPTGAGGAAEEKPTTTSGQSHRLSA